MRQRVPGVVLLRDEGAPDPGVLRRASLWGLLAFCAAVLGVIAIRSETGERRIATALGQPPVMTEQHQAWKALADAEAETRRLTSNIRALANDRDRLLARVETLERGFGDITGALASDSQQKAARQELPPELPSILLAAPPSEPAPMREIPPPPPMTPFRAPAQTYFGTPPPFSQLDAPTPVQTERINNPTAASLPKQSSPNESIITKTEFGIDVGSEKSLDGMRALWNSIKGIYGAQMDNLRPVIAVREGARGNAVELRLVIGPVANASAAAKLCAGFTQNLPCQPVVFDGQRLALR